ncbi:uncharacterized protein EDB91DRAFT_1257801 [Suillus paluster]|uniref:uncharacterized protein n=1 Tax=Suillus paluster TaxID=48578 RepID=UPI001B860983|nr:uncharacterized protein EDB91DRAFT_1257801 [Suillus paluster]KAG1719268.1 hypothetical protein EDB91DRAFT_1257801 [Suillus paluster]
MSQHHVPEDIEVMESSSTAGFDSDSDNLSSDSDKALMKFCAAVVSLWDNALIADLHKALETAQKLLLNMQGQQWEFLKQNVLLETSAAKGQKRLTCNELELAVKKEAIRLLGCKYSITHCLWINSQIFPLCACPNIDINSKERWLSLLSIEDGVKAELFLFIPEADREMMNHKHFSSHVSAVDVLSFETLSDFFSL